MNSARYKMRMLNLALIIPVAALVIETLNTPLVRPEISLLLVAAGAAAALLLGLWTPRRAALANPQVLLMFLGFFGAGYGWAAPILIDLRLDHTASQVFQAPVVKRGLSFGRYGHAQYSLRPGPWGPATSTSTVVVPAETYGAVKAGGMACVTLHPGALAMPWYSAAPC